MRNIRQINGNRREGGFNAMVFALLFAAVCLMALSGCRSPFEPQYAAESGMGTLSLSITVSGPVELIAPPRPTPPVIIRAWPFRKMEFLIVKLA